MFRRAASRKHPAVERPDIFLYHDYRAFLRDWFAFLRSTSDFTVRMLAAQSGLSSAYFSMILSGERSLHFDQLTKFLPFMHLSRSEQSYLERLVKFGESGAPQAKLLALDELVRTPSYRKRNPNEVEFVEYMSHWHYVAIREMGALPDFRPDPEWIRSRLKHRVTITEIREALDFLMKHGYLRVTRDGAATPPKSTLTCKGPVFWPALTQFHKKMFELAAESVEGTHSSERSLEGFTFALDQERFEAAREIILKAMADIEALEKSARNPADRVYHLELALFPLTKKEEGQ